MATNVIDNNLVFISVKVINYVIVMLIINAIKPDQIIGNITIIITRLIIKVKTVIFFIKLVIIAIISVTDTVLIVFSSFVNYVITVLILYVVNNFVTQPN